MIPVIEFEMPVPIYRAVLPVYPSWPGSLSSYRCQRGTESLTRCWYLPGSQPSTSSRYGLVLVCKLQDALCCLFAGSLTKCMKSQIQGNVFCGTRSIMKNLWKGKIWCNTMYYKHVIPLLWHALKYVYKILNTLKDV